MTCIINRVVYLLGSKFKTCYNVLISWCRALTLCIMFCFSIHLRMLESDGINVEITTFLSHSYLFKRQWQYTYLYSKIYSVRYALALSFLSHFCSVYFRFDPRNQWSWASLNPGRVECGWLWSCFCEYTCFSSNKLVKIYFRFLKRYFSWECM